LCDLCNSDWFVRQRLRGAEAPIHGEVICHLTYIIEDHPCHYMSIAAKNAEPSLKKLFGSQKPTNSLYVQNVTALTLGKSCPLLFHLEGDHPMPPAHPEAAAEPAADFPEVGKFNGRGPFS
jgi:hypothetical protein